MLLLLRRPVERAEPLDDVRDRGVERPGAVRRDRGGDLDGDVVDVGALHEGPRAGEAAVGLGGAEHGLAQEVQVEAHAAVPDAGDRAGRGASASRR